ncbi:MAG: VWA domain-containing protein [Streptosporangiaceae bacterium]
MAQVLPFYLVCDESYSMSGPPLDAINASLPEIHSEIGSNPVVADKTRFCLIGFSDTAQVLLPLSNLSAISSIPALQVAGGTNYSSAFDLLYDTIDEDVKQLKNNKDQVYRPAVFFLSDGQPGDDWEDSYKREFAQSLIQSIVTSGSKPAQGGGLTLAVPDDVPGFTSLPADEL